jgi:hypothetical protein
MVRESGATAQLNPGRKRAAAARIAAQKVRESSTREGHILKLFQNLTVPAPAATKSFKV